MSAKEEYCLLSNIPSSFRSSDLRNFFAVFIEERKFDLFHFRHRPQTVTSTLTPEVTSANKCDADSKEGGQKDELGESGRNAASLEDKFCCPIRFKSTKNLDSFMRKYHFKFWMDKEGHELQSRVIISKVDMKIEDLAKFAEKEFSPPGFMPCGNIGTPSKHFLDLIKNCKLPPSLIKKLGLEFPRGRVFKRYSKVPFDYGTSVKHRNRKWEDFEEEDEEYEDIKTGRGHSLSSVYVSNSKCDKAVEDDLEEEEDDKASNVDDDDDRCEEWERHEALNDHRTTHGDIGDEDKERLYEEKIELKWEKGGSGLVFYTDAQFWEDQKGDFDEQTADDWDVDMEGYYVPGGGDKDARDFMEMRSSERFRKGLEEFSVFAPKGSPKPPRPPSPPFPPSKRAKIGAFEKYTRGIGRKILEQHGWKDGQGLGTTIVGMADALDNEGQGPRDLRGFGFYGQKVEFTSKASRKFRRNFKDYRVDAPDRIVIGTIYDTPKQLDVEEPLLRRNAPTYIKRYEFVKGSTQK